MLLASMEAFQAVRLWPKCLWQPRKLLRTISKKSKRGRTCAPPPTVGARGRSEISPPSARKAVGMAVACEPLQSPCRLYGPSESGAVRAQRGAVAGGGAKECAYRGGATGLCAFPSISLKEEVLQLQAQE